MTTSNPSRLFSNSGLISTGMKSTILALLLALLVGCGGNAVSTPSPSLPITAAQVFSNHAETWEFKNGYGDLTWIDVLPQPDGSTIWHYRKNADRAYWMPDGKSAEIYFFLASDSTGAWYSTGGHIIAPFGFPWDATHTPQDFTYTTEAIPGHPRPYLILADSGTNDDTVFPDITAETRWKTSMYVENGMLVSEQWEGPCIHEKWYFAIGRGLVKVVPLDAGSCTGLDPLLTMDRVDSATAAASTPVPNVYFNSGMVGQSWAFVNGYGDHTFIDVQAGPAGSQAQVVWHYTKDNCRAYWNPGDCTSELWFGITEKPDGSWSSTQFLLTCSVCFDNAAEASATIKTPVPGGYLVVPPAQPSFTTGSTGYVPCWQLGALSWVPDNCNPIGATPVPWVTNGYMDNISTPLYSGPVLVSEQFENCPGACTHEKWYFAPNIGLVKVEQLQNGSTIDDPLLAMQRIP